LTRLPSAGSLSPQRARIQLTPLDWAVIGLYFSILLAVAWWVVRQGKDTAADYFLAGRNLSWWLVGASIFASNIGSEHVVGLAGSGVTDGVAMAHYELHALCLLVLAWVFVPSLFQEAPSMVLAVMKPGDRIAARPAPEEGEPGKPSPTPTEPCCYSPYQGICWPKRNLKSIPAFFMAGLCRAITLKGLVRPGRIGLYSLRESSDVMNSPPLV